ncbi:MAG: DUF4276 family protein, partial [Magnetococcales bacterium]|nr:DUF4276 family protein [Magnetococcales bacterium]
MNIALIVEGKTEKAFLPHLRGYLQNRLSQMPRLNGYPYDGLIPTQEKLKRVVYNLLKTNDHVIALTDVYTGQSLYVDADDAIRKMRQWVGAEPRFHPHAAQYDFEAWLLP